MEIREKLMKFLAEEAIDGIVLPVEDIPKMSKELAKEYVVMVKEMDRSRVFHNELNRLKVAAESNIVRHAKNDAEIAWNRGILHGLESLESRIRMVGDMKLK